MRNRGAGCFSFQRKARRCAPLKGSRTMCGVSAMNPGFVSSVSGDSASRVVTYDEGSVPAIVGGLSSVPPESALFVRVSARRGWIQSKLRDSGY